MQLPQTGKWNYHMLRSLVNKKHEQLTVKGRGKLKSALDLLKKLPKSDWQRPHASSIGNSTYVIRFKDENSKNHRLFGHFYDPHDSFVVTITGYEKNDTYHPNTYETECSQHKHECDKDFAVHTIALRSQCVRCNENDNDKDLQLPSLYGR